MHSKRGDILFYAAIAAMGVWAAWHAWLYRFLCDDAYISFRYVENALIGRGLVFNPGEYVEGYTNFLWVIELIALRWLTGWAIEPLAFGLTSVYTVGFLVAAALLAYRTPLDLDKRVVCVLTLAGLALNRNVAVWSTSGLETRQFSFFIVLAILLLTTRERTVGRTIAASFAMVLATLTRPDSLLLWGCAGLWIIGMHWRDIPRLVKLSLAWGVPFCVIISAHFLWRYSYYGEWLPNTYYAKVIGTWWQGGAYFFSLAALENSLYFFIPLTLYAAWRRGRDHGDTMYVLYLMLAVPHAVYWAKAGGDHFEYRIIDFWWPIITLGAIEGAMLLGRFARERFSPRAGVAVTAIVLGVTALYTYSFQSLKTRPTPETKPGPMRSYVGDDASPHVELLPLGAMLMEAYHGISVACNTHFIAVPHLRHRELWIWQREGYVAYTATWEDHPLPEGLIMAQGVVGIVPYYLQDVVFIDELGLVDYNVARMPVEVSNEDRRLAHDRSAPESYLNERGCNINIERAQTELSEALTRGLFAAEIAPGLWMPFDIRFEVVDYRWVTETFADYTVWTNGPNGEPVVWIDPAG